MKPAASVLTIIILAFSFMFPFSHANAYRFDVGPDTGSQGKKNFVTVVCKTSHPVQVTFIYTNGKKKILKMSKNSKAMRDKGLKAIILPGGVRKNLKNGQVWIIKD